MTGPTMAPANAARTDAPSRMIVRARTCLAIFFLVCAGIHIWLAMFSPGSYEHFADGALSDVVRARWNDVFMADPTAWALAVAWGEAVLGTALLMAGFWTRLGYTGIIAFNAMLMLFGWGFWLWSVPALAAVMTLAIKDGLLGPRPVNGS